MKRSTSTSHIPVPSTNLFNVGKRRSRSCTRSSGSSVTSLFKPKRESSESKLSVNRLSKLTPYTQLKITPQNQQKFGKPSSQSKITPSSTQRSSNFSGAGSSSGLRERKTIKKLSSNKKWVSEQYSKVMNFIESSGLFDPEIASPDHLKSLTIKSFVYVSSVLLGQIFSTINLTTANYKEVIPAKLKVLKYPGTLTNSVLITVNTAGTWPQIMGFFGWLVDKIVLKNYFDNLSLSVLEPQTRQNYLITERCKEFFIQRYVLYNNSEDTEEKTQKTVDEYVNDLKVLLGVDNDEYFKLEHDVHKKAEYILKQKNDITDLQSNIEEMQAQIDSITKEIDEFEEKDIVEETTLEGELKYVQNRLNHVRKAKDIVISNVNCLQKTVNSQSCTYQEKLDLLKKNEELRHAVDIKKEKIAHAQNIRHEFEENVNTDREMLENACISWNRFLQKWIIKKPQLKILLLRETGFHQESFLSEIKEVVKQINIVNQELVEEYATIQKKIKIEQSKKYKLEAQLESLNNTIESLDEDCSKFEKRNAAIEENIKNLKAKLQSLKETCQQRLQEETDLQLQAQGIKKECEQLEMEVKKFSTKVVGFLIEYKDQILTCATQSKQLVEKVENELLDHIINKQNNILAALENFEKNENQ